MNLGVNIMSRKKLSVLSLVSAALLIFGTTVSASRCNDYYSYCNTEAANGVGAKKCEDNVDVQALQTCQANTSYAYSNAYNLCMNYHGC